MSGAPWWRCWPHAGRRASAALGPRSRRPCLTADAHLAIAGADLLDPAGCEAAVAQVLARHGRLDMVAHTVGAFAMAPIAEATPAHWLQMFQINLMSTLNLYRAAIAADARRRARQPGGDRRHGGAARAGRDSPPMPPRRAPC